MKKSIIFLIIFILSFSLVSALDTSWVGNQNARNYSVINVKNVNATTFYGDGSYLTGIVTSSVLSNYAKLNETNYFTGSNIFDNITILNSQSINGSISLYNTSGTNTIYLNGLDNSYFLNKVGIRTNNPSQPLEVNGSMLLSSATGILYLQSTLAKVSGSSTGEVGINYNNSGTSTNSFAVYNGTTSLINILRNGNVGIGTINPLSLIDVSGTSRFRGSTTYANSTGTSFYSRGIGGVFGLQTQDLGVGNGYYYLLNSTSSSTVGISMRNGNSWIGNVAGARLGVGTSSPTSALDIRMTSTNDSITISGTDGQRKQLVLANGTTHLWKTGIISTTGADYAFFDGTQNTLLLGKNGTVSIVPTSGNVGIGTTTPFHKLHVAGNSYISGNMSIGNGQSFGSYSGNNGSIRFDINEGLGFKHGSGIVGTVFNPNNGNLLVGSSNLNLSTRKLVVVGSTNITSNIQAGNYTSADGTLGFTGTCTILGLTSITVKNGLITGCS